LAGFIKVCLSKRAQKKRRLEKKKKKGKHADTNNVDALETFAVPDYY
jgi:hypothetical protein